MKKTIRLIALAMVTLILCLALASCGGPNADPEKAKEALEDAGYVVILNDGGVLGDLALPDGAEATLSAVKGDGDEIISIVYYEDTDALNEAWEDAQEEAKELEEEYEDIVCKKSGKMIYIGTKNAVKDAK